MRTRQIGGMTGSALAAIVLLLGGCRTAVNTVENADKAGVRQEIQDKRVVTDATMNKRVVVTTINVGQSPTGVLRAQIELLNKKNSIQSIFYSVEWFDADGMRITTASGGWTQQQFMPRESLFITLSAPTPIAKDFRLKLMENPQ